MLGLYPYSTARDECGELRPEIFLDANESPYNNGVNRYPDPRQKELKDRIASIKGIPVENLFLGNGSDEAIDLCYRVFCPPGKSSAVSIDPSYGMYSVAAAMNDVRFVKVSLRPDFSLDMDSLMETCGRAGDARLLFMCSPNNPSGNSFPKEIIVEVLERFKGMVVLDEAYIDFSEQASVAGMVEEYPNLIVLQTLSKAWGMAGLRIGLAVAAKEVIALMSKLKYPYNISVVAQKMALQRLDVKAKDAHVAEIIGQRFILARELKSCPGVRKVWPSDANFLLVEFYDPKAAYNLLVSQGLIVRDRSSQTNCAGCLRITVGTPAENRRLLSVLRGPSVPELVEGPANGIETLGERHVRITRKTSETDIVLELDLDANGGNGKISTGLGFFDHMLDQIPRHGGIRLDITAKGDLEVDEHHTMEDVGIALGEALAAALGSKLGIGRYGFVLPMDDCDAMVLMDFGGRNDFRWDVEFTREMVGDVPTEMFSHFFQSVSSGARCNLHVKAVGDNDHHKAEAVFKAFARALRMSVARSPFPYEIPSSKGVL